MERYVNKKNITKYSERVVRAENEDHGPENSVYNAIFYEIEKSEKK